MRSLRWLAVWLLLCLITLGQSAYVTLMDGRQLRVGAGESVQDGHARLYIEKLPSKGALYAVRLEDTGRPCWRWPEVVGGDWIAYREYVLELPDGMRPIYWPLDGTVPREGPKGTEWVIEGPAHPRAIDRGNPGRDPQPSAGHCLEGRQIFSVIFGEPGNEVELDHAGEKALDRFLVGGYGGGGNANIQRVVDQWDSGPSAFNPQLHPWTAGTYFTSGSYLFAGLAQTRGRAFGATPGADGWGAGGENARYMPILPLLAHGTPQSMQAALVIARHVAGHGWIHASKETNADAWRYGFLTGRRRYEKSDGSDFVGSSFPPDGAHLWSADIQLAAACFPDPLLVRTANEARDHLMKPGQIWYPNGDSRTLDRWLEGLMCAYHITGDSKYLDRAETAVNDAVAAIPAGDDFFRGTGAGATYHVISVWMDGCVLARIQEMIDLGRCGQHRARVMRHCAWLRDHAVSPTGRALYQLVQDPTLANDQWTPVDPGWGVLSAELLSCMWWAAQQDVAFRPVAARLVRYWAATFTATSEWVIPSNAATAKTRGEELEAERRDGKMIRDALSWAP